MKREKITLFIEHFLDFSKKKSEKCRKKFSYRRSENTPLSEVARRFNCPERP